MSEQQVQALAKPVAAGEAAKRCSRAVEIIPVALLLLLASIVSAQPVSHQRAQPTASAMAAAAETGVEATSVPLNNPTGIALDAYGNLYLSDTDNNIVRKVDSLGIITTLAGTGAEGFAGDGGAPTSAELDSPAGVAVDTSGNLYIADTNNNRIRKVTGSTITTVAGTGIASYSGDGGAAASAALSAPTALAVDTSGNLYIADTGNNVIRKITGTTIATIAGSGREGFAGDGGQAILANLNTPGGIAVDSTGTLYIADTDSNRIRKVTPAGIIATIAGTGAPGNSGDGSSATAALLDQPQGIALDSNGNIFFADSNNNRIREIASNGNITTVVGNGLQGHSGDLGIALSSTLDTPLCVAVTANGSVALADTGNDRVRLVSLNGAINTVAGIAPTAEEGLGISASAPSALYGTPSVSATFRNGSNTATGLVTFTDVANGSVALGSAPLTSKVATLALPSLLVGIHKIVAGYAGDGSNAAVTSGIYVLTVTPAPITATAAGVSQQYGVAIPVLTGSLTGVLAQDAANVAGVFSTTATSTSPPETYPISVALSGSAAPNYAVALATASGSLVITKAASVTTLTLSATTQSAGIPVVLTAKAASTTTGTPTGSIVFSDNGTAIATVALTNGGAQAGVSTLAAGTHTLTAAYDGDTNFTASNGAASETITTFPDFTLSASTSGQTTQTVFPGSAAIFNLTLQPQNGSFTSPITLSASNLPPNATAIFSPATITPGSAAAGFTMTVQTTAAATRLITKEVGAAAFALLLLPLAGTRRMRRAGKRFGRNLLALLFSLAVLGTIWGCGDTASGFFGQAPKTYTITITGTATSVTNTMLQHSTTVTLTVQ